MGNPDTIVSPHANDRTVSRNSECPTHDRDTRSRQYITTFGNLARSPQNPLTGGLELLPRAIRRGRTWNQADSGSSDDYVGSLRTRNGKFKNVLTSLYYIREAIQAFRTTVRSHDRLLRTSGLHGSAVKAGRKSDSSRLQGIIEYGHCGSTFNFSLAHDLWQS